MSEQFLFQSVSLSVLLDNKLFSLDHSRPTCTKHTMDQSRVHSSTSACLLTLPEYFTDLKQTLLSRPHRGNRMQVYETLANEKMEFRVSPSLCRVFFSLYALSRLSLGQCVLLRPEDKTISLPKQQSIVKTHSLCVQQTYDPSLPLVEFYTKIFPEIEQTPFSNH